MPRTAAPAKSRPRHGCYRFSSRHPFLVEGIQGAKTRQAQPHGLASDGVGHAYSKGQHDVGAHGFNATLEDWGRFGQFILHNGTLPGGKQILPEGWVKQSSDWTQAKGSGSAAHPNGLYG